MTTTSPSAVRAPATPAALLHRMGPTVFAHAQVAMLATTDTGVVVEANTHAAFLLGRMPTELAQEPIEQHVQLVPDASIAACLPQVVCSTEPLSLGPCRLRRRNLSIGLELVVSSAFRAAGRPVLLMQLVLTG